MTPANRTEMMAAVTASLKMRTGRTLQEWVDVVTAAGQDPLDQNGVRRWLKSDHGVAQNSQWAIADAAAQAAGWRRPTVEEYIDQQYAGAKLVLRSLFDHLRETCEGFGTDVTVEGRKPYVPFIRRRQFAAVAAATRQRVDVGVRLVAQPDSSPLVPSSTPGQATHRLSVASLTDVTPQVVAVLRAAYQQNG
jgi:hypothetical protein